MAIKTPRKQGDLGENPWNDQIQMSKSKQEIATVIRELQWFAPSGAERFKRQIDALDSGLHCVLPNLYSPFLVLPNAEGSSYTQVKLKAKFQTSKIEPEFTKVRDSNLESNR